MFATLYRYPHPHDSTKFIYCGQAVKPERRDRQHRSGKTSFGRRFKSLFPGVELPQPIREVVEIQYQLELNELETIWMFQYHTWWGYDEGMNLSFPGGVNYEDLARSGGLIGGRKSKELGVGAFAPGMREKAHRKAKELGVGIHSPESREKARLGILKMKEQGKGIFEPAAASRGRHKTKELGIGIHSLESKAKVRLAVFKQKELGIGIHSADSLAKAHLKQQELGVGIHSPGMSSKGARIGNCLRYKIARGKPCVCGTHEQIAA